MVGMKESKVHRQTMIAESVFWAEGTASGERLGCGLVWQTWWAARRLRVKQPREGARSK